MASLSQCKPLVGSTVALRGAAVQVRTTPCAAARVAAPIVVAERFRLDNLGPEPGSRRKKMRKGRGYGGHQGGTCGFGMRGQNARSGSGTRPGFEGGQTPLYRRLPKLKGIAGGMSAGVASYVTVNVEDIAEKFEEGAVVDLEALKEKKVLNLSGREAKLPLKVLATGEISGSYTIKAAAFSAKAAEKIAAAGGTAEVVPVKAKWTRAAHEAKVAAAAN